MLPIYLLHNFMGWMEFLVVAFPLPAQGLFRCCSPEVLSVTTEPLPYPGEMHWVPMGFCISSETNFLRFYLESVDLMSHLFIYERNRYSPEVLSVMTVINIQLLNKMVANLL